LLDIFKYLLWRKGFMDLVAKEAFKRIFPDKIAGNIKVEVNGRIKN